MLILYYAVNHWNDYFNALIYNNKAANAPLQTILREILLLNQAFQNGVGGVQGGVQKYFEKGVMIGAVKG